MNYYVLSPKDTIVLSSCDTISHNCITIACSSKATTEQCPSSTCYRPCYHDIVIVGIIVLFLVFLVYQLKKGLLCWQKEKNRHIEDREKEERKANEDAKDSDANRKKEEKELDWNLYQERHAFDLIEYLCRESSKTKYQHIAEFVNQIKDKDGIVIENLLKEFLKEIEKDYK